MAIEYFECYNKLTKKTLRGMIHKYSDHAPIIIISHGYFSANKIGPQRLFVEIADALCNIGYNVVRFDYSGMGESDGVISEIVYDNHVSDLLSVTEEIKKMFPNPEINLIGHCGGCNCVIDFAKRSSCKINSITMLSPFIFNDKTASRLLGESLVQDLQLKGFAYRKGLYCHQSFFTAANAMNSDFSSLGLPVYVFWGAKDQFVDFELYNSWILTKQLEAYLIDGADHNYIDRNARMMLLAKLTNHFSKLIYQNKIVRNSLMYKLIALDLDGTLLTEEKTISPRTKAALIKAADNGIKIVLASARPFYRMEKYAIQLGINNEKHCSISFNGGLVIGNDKKFRIVTKGFDTNQIKEVIALGKQYDTSISVYTEDSLLTEKISEMFAGNKHSSDVNFVTVDFDSFDFSSVPVYKIVFVNEPERTKQIRDIIPAYFYENFEISSSVPQYVEFVPKGITKSQALHQIGEYFGIDKSEMIAVGDQENDLPMLLYAGLSVAMGNASENVKEQVQVITASNDNDGIADIVENYLL